MLSYGRYDLMISRETIVDWFNFPNPFFNVLVIRDERTMNVTQIGEWSLVLNATNSTLVKKYKDYRITAQISSVNYEVMNFKRLEVRFLEKYNTSIFSSSKVNEVNVLYNCGLQTLDYKISDYLDGPNYNLTVVNKSDSSEDSGKYFKFEN